MSCLIDLFNITMLFLSESSIHIFNQCAVAIFRLTDLTEAINEKVKIGCTGIDFTYAFRQQHWVSGQCSCPQANMKENQYNFNNILLIGCACYCPLWLCRTLLYDR